MEPPAVPTKISSETFVLRPSCNDGPIPPKSFCSYQHPNECHTVRSIFERRHGVVQASKRKPHFHAKHQSGGLISSQKSKWNPIWVKTKLERESLFKTTTRKGPFWDRPGHVCFFVVRQRPRGGLLRARAPASRLGTDRICMSIEAWYESLFLHS